MPMPSNRVRRHCLGLLLATWVAAAPMPAVVRGAGAEHPLDPLSKEEITAAVQILKDAGKVGPESRFAFLGLHEPRKDEVLRFKAGSPVRREAFAVVYEPAANRTYEAVIDLKGKQVPSWKEVPGVQPGIMPEEYGQIDRLIQADHRYREALQKRGITDIHRVQIDQWASGHEGPGYKEGDRMARAIFFYLGPDNTPYLRPIEGLSAYVDLTAHKVIDILDTGVVPVAKDSPGFGVVAPRNYPACHVEGGPEVRGNEVRWQNWRFRFAVHPREGVVLYTVAFHDQGRWRSVLYRGSLAELLVTYGDPGRQWAWRSTFDEGEYGLGWFLNNLRPPADCPAQAVLADAVLADDRGAPAERPHAVALYERDGGVLWVHRGLEREPTRRSRELVLSSAVTLGNYVYGIDWVFHQDGTLEVEAVLTGMVLGKGVAPAAGGGPGAADDYGRLVAPQVEGVDHQHFFCFRLDMDIDGPAGNRVTELNTEAVPPGPENPQGNGFRVRETLLPSEGEARRQLNLASGRRWKVTNPSIKNSLGQPVGYVLLPGENAVPYAAPGSLIRRRAPFLDAAVWATRYDPDQLYPAGDYVNQSTGGKGLAEWMKADRSLDGADVVLWYTLGVLHQPCPEEWPIMSAHRTGFRLVPYGFFARNPALDAPK